MSTKRTYQPSKIRRRKVHGFLARKRSGGNVIALRRRKGRKRLAV